MRKVFSFILSHWRLNTYTINTFYCEKFLFLNAAYMDFSQNFLTLSVSMKAIEYTEIITK